MPMRSMKLYFCFVIFTLMALGATTSCSPKQTPASQTQSTPTPLTSLTAPSGGKIVYGHVDGATTQAQAMGNILKILHQNLGERPQVGQLFKLKNTDTVAVFFSAVNHPGGNVPVAGLLIAANAGPNNIEAALVSDDASRFNSTVNPMLRQLFTAWHPAGLASSSQAPNGTATSTSASAQSGPTPHLNTVSPSDQSATVGIADGWRLDPSSTHGQVLINGPQGEVVGLCLNKTAIDSNNPQARANLARGIKVRNTIYYPYTTDVKDNLVNLFQAWRQTNGLGPAQIHLDSLVDSNQGSGLHCAQGKGQINGDGKGSQGLNALVCVTELQGGYYLVRMNYSVVPLNLVTQDSAAISAMANSIKENLQVIQQEYNSDTQKSLANSRASIAKTQQIGQQTTARINAAHAAEDQQHASYWAQQDQNARQSTSFGNYLLDQTVLQSNGSGGETHATVSNSTANALIKADPSRFEAVSQPNYWKGVDY